MRRVEILKTDLHEPLRLQELKTDLVQNDEGGNEIIVQITDSGEAYTPTGSIKCYMIRPDTTTITIDGTIVSNGVSVVLPAQAYYYTGRANFVIKSESEGNAATLAAFSALVYRDRTDRITDEERIIPSLEEVLTIVAQINDMTIAATTLPAGSNATASLSTVSGHYHIALGIPRGASGTEPDVQSITLPVASWEGTGPWTQTVSVSGVTAASTIVVGIDQDVTAEVYENAVVSGIVCTGQGAGTLTFTAFLECPAYAIPLTVMNLSESGDSLTDYTESEITEILDSVYGG